MEWMDVREQVIIRDCGWDLGVEGWQIVGTIYVHHMNPILPNDLVDVSEILINPEFLVCVSKRTHDAIHFGDASLLPQLPNERTPNDMCPWKQV